ncbi:lipase 3-like [Cimex lectularius]|uniref:Lipase n=1 Tax=Cimex lectularius TaxID=79782 RepID=A0A8I6RCD5_CIMLE|nr:lipase 3-like [Cimex lectularius]
MTTILLICGTLFIAVGETSLAFSLDGYDSKIDSPLGPKSMADMVLPHGYPLEEHEIETEDGYLLTVYRIPYGLNNSAQGSRRPPLFLQHGILSNSACWVLSDPSKGLAFILADAGYDVWMGNSRGSTYSRKHRTLNPDIDKAQFWNFSFHEMGYYDLPVVIDFIRERTKEDKVTYVGHSQGTTIYFVLASTRPEYNDRIKVMSALAPIAFLGHTRGTVRLLTRFSFILTKIIQWWGIYELFRDNFLLHFLVGEICRRRAFTRPICDNTLFLFAGFDSQQLNSSLIPEIADHSPGGASSKQFIHFGQLANNGEKFRMFDYGRDNRNHYGSDAPPEYPLGKVTSPVILQFSDNDWLAGIKDVEKLYGSLPNARKFEVPYPYFNHLDFLWAINVREVLYDPLIKMLKEYQ